MPNLFSSFSECLGFSQIIKSLVLSVSIALKVMSSKLPIGVATIYIPFSILIKNLFILSCTPIKLPKQSQQLEKAERLEVDKLNIVQQNEISSSENFVKDFEDTDLTKDITVIFSNNNKESFTKQFVNVLELALFNKGLDKVSFDIEYFNDEKELQDIIERSKTKGKIFIGPTEVNHTKIAKSFCDNGKVKVGLTPLPPIIYKNELILITTDNVIKSFDLKPIKWLKPLVDIFLEITSNFKFSFFAICSKSQVGHIIICPSEFIIPLDPK